MSMSTVTVFPTSPLATPPLRSASPSLDVLVADADRRARADLVRALHRLPGVGHVTEAGDAVTARSALASRRPELVVLEVELPGGESLHLAADLLTGGDTRVAFVTKSNRCAVAAFELGALDYVLKPATPGRLQVMLERARERTTSERSPAPGPPSQYLERIPVRRRDEVVLVPVEAVASAVADGDLVHITTQRGDRHVITSSLRHLENRLPPDRFVRLSRGCLANVRMIARFSPMPGGSLVATLVNGVELGVSRSQARVLRDGLLRL